MRTRPPTAHFSARPSGDPTSSSARPPGEPEPNRRPNHLAARAARWSTRHRLLAIGGWLLAVVLVTVLGGMYGTRTLTDAEYSVGEDARAQKLIEEHGFTDPASENVLIQRDTPAASAEELLADPGLRAAIVDVAGRVTLTGQVANVQSPVELAGVEPNPALVSPDLRSVLVTFDLTGDPDSAADRIEPVLEAVSAAADAHPGYRIEQFGDASADKALSDTIGKDFQRAELLAIPLTLGILLAVFGAVVAALVPVVLALTAFVAAVGLVAFSSRVFPTDEIATSVMLLIGLAVGVDYALFYIRREREERAAGHGPERALEIAAETSGHAVLVSGLTVAVSMAGLLLTGLSVFSGIATGTVIVVLVAVLGSLTVLPAVLSWLGDRVDALRLPWARRARSRAAHRKGSSGGRAELVEVLGRTADADLRARGRGAGAGMGQRGLMGWLLRRPGPVAAVTGGLLILLAVPALGLRTAEPGIDDIPHDLPIMQTYERLTTAFPSEQNAAVVVVSADDVTTPQVTSAIEALREQAVASGEMFEPITVETSEDRQVALVTLPMVGNGTDDESIEALRTLREAVIPATVGALPGVEANVTGYTAGSSDFNDRLAGRTPLVIGFVLVLAFGLLLTAFRSALVAAVAVVLNMLSVGAAYGLLVLVFQNHWADGLLDYTSTGKITNWLPLMLFVVLFGLSMDYQVFVLSRIREARLSGLPMRDAVALGVRRTAGPVTSAAVIMVAVFSVFATLSQVSLKQLGVGLAAAILLDATVIRVVLMPAVLTLLGDRVWRSSDRGADADRLGALTGAAVPAASTPLAATAAEAGAGIPAPTPGYAPGSQVPGQPTPQTR